MKVCPESEPAIAEKLGLDALLVLPEAPEEQIVPTSYSSKEESLAEKKQEIALPRQEILDLYHEFRPQLLRYLRSLYLSREEANEAIQETFLRLATELAYRRTITNKGGWIIRVARNIAIDMLSKREKEEAYIADATSVELEAFVDPNAGPYEIYRNKEWGRRMKAELSALNPQQLQCFRLRAQGFRLKDIGHALGISEQRAFAILKKVTSRLVIVCK